MVGAHRAQRVHRAREAHDVLLHQCALGLHDEFLGDAFEPAPRHDVAGVAREHCASPAADTLLSPDFELDLERVRALLELQSDHVIAIGE